MWSDQPRRMTLLYGGVIANSVFWRETRVNGALDPGLFQSPAN